MSFAEAFVHELRAATEAAAEAAWQRLGERDEGPTPKRAAANAMRGRLAEAELAGVVVVGDGDVEATGLMRGARLGTGRDTPVYDLAIDPVEGSPVVGEGRAGALAVLAAGPRGALFDPGPAFYMEKLVVPPPARGKVDPAAPVAARLEALSQALGKPIETLTIYVLEKPRHRRLVAEIREAGANVHLEPAGDIVGAILASIEGSGVDALMGTGGTPEGVMSACAIRAMGGDFYGRLDPQLHSERAALREEGLSTALWRGIDELCRDDDVFFCATGISDGMLLDGIALPAAETMRVQTLVMSGRTRERQVITSFRPNLGRTP